MQRFFRENDLSIAVIVLSYWSYLMVSAMWGTWSIDMSAVYMAGHFAHYSDPTLMYAAPDDLFSHVRLPEFDVFLSLYGHQEKPQTAFVYPPIWAFVASALANRVDPVTFFDMTRIVMTVSFAASVLVTWRLMAVRHMSATAFALLACVLGFLVVPVKFAIFLNQPHLVVILLILLAFERYIAGWKVTAGVLLGLAAAVKVTPIALALIFVADRNWRALGACVITSAAFLIASFAIGGVDLHLVFLERVAQVDALVPMHGFNMTFETVMHDFFVPLHLLDPDIPIATNTAWVALASKLLLALSLAASLWITRGYDWSDRVRLRLFYLYIATIFFGPLAWMHYYVLPLLMIPAFSGIWRHPSALITAVFLAVGFSSPLMMGLFTYGQSMGGPDIFHAQHTALFPLVFFCALLPIWMRRGETERLAVAGAAPVPGE